MDVALRCSVHKQDMHSVKGASSTAARLQAVSHALMLCTKGPHTRQLCCNQNMNAMSNSTRNALEEQPVTTWTSSAQFTSTLKQSHLPVTAHDTFTLADTYIIHDLVCHCSSILQVHDEGHSKDVWDVVAMEPTGVRDVQMSRPVH